MVGVDEYARAVAPHGTTGICRDPHELCDVVGLRGVEEMAKLARLVPLKVMITTPSCVPAVPGFEDTGASVGVGDVERTMGWDCVVGLGEMMNYPGILACDENALGEVSETLRCGRTVTGHYGVSERDRGLNAYVAASISACHESVHDEDVLAKLRLGMYAQIREGSAWQNLHDLAPVIAGGRVDARLCQLVSDDTHPNTLVSEGHLDRILRMAVREGIDAVTAIQMVTLNMAECFRLAQDLGSVTPGKCTDLVFLEDFRDFRVTCTIIDGELVAEGGQALFAAPTYEYPSWMTDTMHVGGEIDERSFRIPAVGVSGAPLAGESATVRSIHVSGGSTLVDEELAQVPIEHGCLMADGRNDLLKAVVFERHHKMGRHAAGFVRGFGIHGALAQTVAHDAHNLLVVGDNDADMVLAARTLVACGGGEVAVEDGKVLGLVELPICGLMSPHHVEDVTADVAQVEEAWRAMGCGMPSPFMTMGLLFLTCIPSLRLTDRGYVDTNRFRFVPLVVE